MTVSAQNPAVPPESQPPGPSLRLTALDLPDLLLKPQGEATRRVEGQERDWFNQRCALAATDAYRDTTGDWFGPEDEFDTDHVIGCGYERQQMGAVHWHLVRACISCDAGTVITVIRGKKHYGVCDECGGTGAFHTNEIFQTTPDCTQVILPPPETWQRALDEFSGVRAPWS